MPTQSVSLGHSWRSGIANSADSAGHQGSKGGATRSAEDGNRTAIQKQGNDRHENALENRLNGNFSER